MRDTYNEIGINAPNAAEEQHTTMVTAMPGTGASTQMGIPRYNLVTATKTGGSQWHTSGPRLRIFPEPDHGKSSQMVYVTLVLVKKRARS